MSTDIDYENPWTYNGEVFGSGDVQDYFGFVYHIHCSKTNRDYIGPAIVTGKQIGRAHV